MHGGGGGGAHIEAVQLGSHVLRQLQIHAAAVIERPCCKAEGWERARRWQAAAGSGGGGQRCTSLVAAGRTCRCSESDLIHCRVRKSRYLVPNAARSSM